MTDIAHNRSNWEQRDFSRLIAELHPAVTRFAYSLCKNAALAEDLVQESCFKAWKYREQFKPGTNFKAWMFMIVRNLYYSERRRSWRVVELDQQFAENIPAHESVAEEEAAHDLNALKLYLLCLPLEQRDALVASGYLGLTYEEAATALGCPVGTIKSRVFRGRDALDRLMKGPPVDTHGLNIQSLRQATDGIPKNHPFYSIAQAYEELYRDCVVPSRRGQLPVAPPVRVEQTALDREWDKLVGSGALDQDNYTLDELMQYDEF